MAKLILMEEYHVTAYAPPSMTAAQFTAIRQALDERRFRALLRRTVRAVFRRHPALQQIHVRLSR